MNFDLLIINKYSSYYFSKKSVFDGKKAIRGGIPVVFRKFTFECFLLF